MIVSSPADLPEFELILQKDKPEVMDFYLYFLYYRDDLVYIGMTDNLKSRLTCHKADKLFDRITYKFYPQISKKEMRVIEAQNIKHYDPFYNNSKKQFLSLGEVGLWRYNYNFMGIIEVHKENTYTRGDYEYYYNGETLERI